MIVAPIDSKTATALVVEHHYLHRRSSVRYAFALYTELGIVGVVIFGTPASRHLQVSVCPASPNHVLELNRLWVNDIMPRNTESWFVARAMKMLPPCIVVSYADTKEGHYGYVYRALNFNYSGWTDMDRKSPRVDYVTEGKHSRATFREGGAGTKALRVPRVPKIKYWLVAGGNKRDKRALQNAVAWPSLDWNDVALGGEMA